MKLVALSIQESILMEKQIPLPDVMRVITATSFVSSAALAAAFLVRILSASAGVP